MTMRTSVVLLFISTLVFMTAAKKTDYSKFVDEVDNVKTFKKILRTKTNVLVMFGLSMDECEKVMPVFGEAAQQTKGSATLLKVDCSTKEGKKLCKKEKARPDTVVLKHYNKDGESQVYDRKMSVKSMVHFLHNPKADGPWEDEDGSSDVVHIDTEKQFNKMLQKNKPTLVMFYAPWCGHCKRFKPAFAEAATELKGKCILAGVDADSGREAMFFRETYNVTGFPKTIYFENGEMKMDYSGGHTKDNVIEWLKDPQAPKEPEPEVGWDESENDVIHLTDETFDEFVAENNKVLVFFYAPWCGHCKNLKPDWEKAATTLKEEEAPEKLTAVDATKFNALAQKFKVSGYPTIVYMEDGEQKYDASSAFKRTAEGIVEYIKDPKAPPPPEKEWSETESDVVHLTDESFKSTVKKRKHALIMFYAPWCGHCKKAKPHFTASAETFKDNKKVMFGAVDCTKNKATCDSFDVSGYPTLYYTSYGKNQDKYQSGREEEDFTSFMAGQSGTTKSEL